jgi:hypothetical protein
MKMRLSAQRDKCCFFCIKEAYSLGKCTETEVDDMNSLKEIKNKLHLMNENAHSRQPLDDF